MEIRLVLIVLVLGGGQCIAPNQLEKKFNHLEKRLLQDMWQLRDSVEATRNDIGAIFEILNKTTNFESVKGQVSTTNDKPINEDMGVAMFKEMKTDLSEGISRIKRAFSEEKGIMHSTMKELIEKTGAFGESFDKRMRDIEMKIDSKIEKKNNEINDMLKTNTEQISATLGSTVVDINDMLKTNIETISATLGSTVVDIKNEIESMANNVLDDMNVCKAMNGKLDNHENHVTREVKYLENLMFYVHGYVYPGQIHTFGNDKGYNIRLANATGFGDGYQGRLEVMYNGVWGTVCDDDFDNNAAFVACNMLGGYPNYGYKGVSHYGLGSGPTWIDNVKCSGYEKTLFDCPHIGIEGLNCGHDEDVGVWCYHKR